MCFGTSVTNSKENSPDDLTKSILFMFLIYVSKIEISLKRIRIVPKNSYEIHINIILLFLLIY